MLPAWNGVYLHYSLLRPGREWTAEMTELARGLLFPAYSYTPLLSGQSHVSVSLWKVITTNIRVKVVLTRRQERNTRNYTGNGGYERWEQAVRWSAGPLSSASYNKVTNSRHVSNGGPKGILTAFRLFCLPHNSGYDQWSNWMATKPQKSQKTGAIHLLMDSSGLGTWKCRKDPMCNCVTRKKNHRY